MIVAASLDPARMGIPLSPPAEPLPKKPALDAGSEEATPEATSALSVWLDDIGRTVRARYAAPALWICIAALGGLIALGGAIPIAGPLLLLSGCALFLSMAGLAAMDLEDGIEPTFSELLPRALRAAGPVLLTWVWLLAMAVAWAALPVLTGLAFTKLGLPEPLLVPLGACWFVGGLVFLFTSCIYALPAALVDGAVGPAATAASRRCWSENRLRTMVGFLAAKLLMNCEAMVVMVGVGLAGLPLVAVLAMLAPGGPASLPSAGPLASVVAFGGMACLFFLMLAGILLVTLSLPIHMLLVYRRASPSK